MKKYAKEFGGLGLQRGQIGKTRMAVATQLLDYYQEELADETDPTAMGEVDLPGGEDRDTPNLEGPDKNKLKQLENLIKSMDDETKSVAMELMDMVQGGADVSLEESQEETE